ncbi:MAG: SMP-30/gluconolactonase/LRE family protein [Candidatus Symbiobacter sp.]|nr:SMP-30/gluconolactonase/LRE family protein [Candidatus Symbiobacter sp.]
MKIDANLGQIYEYYDPEFYQLTIPIAPLTELFNGGKWCEGPVWFADHQCLIWSDIPNNRMMRYVPGAIHHATTALANISIFRANSHYSNGNTRDREGRLVSCQHGSRSVTRSEWDGTITELVSHYKGKRLNSPNDVVVKSDGTIWFTDPIYGILTDYEGYKSEPELPGCYVYCYDPKSGELKMVADDFHKPNGLAFSPDEAKLYIADSGYTHDKSAPRHIRVFNVNDNNQLSHSQIFFEVTDGVPDGMRLDRQGRVWTSSATGVICVNAAGAALGKINVPQLVSNLAFGGVRGNEAYITAGTSLYHIVVGVAGARGSVRSGG